MEDTQTESTSTDDTLTQAVTHEVEETSTTDDASTEDEATNDESQEDESQESEDESESQEDDDESDDEEALVPLSKLKKARSEAKNLRSRLREAESAIEELHQVQKTNDFQAKYEDLLATVRQERLSALLNAELANAVEPTAAINLIKPDDVTWEDNQPTNVQELVKNLKSAYPRLFTTGTTNAGARDEAIDYNSLNLTPQQRIALAYKN